MSEYVVEDVLPASTQKHRLNQQNPHQHQKLRGEFMLSGVIQTQSQTV